MSDTERIGEHPETGRERLRHAKRQVGFVVGAMGVLALLSLAGFAFLLWPWEGMEVYSFEPTKTEVCPMEVVGAERDYRIDPDADVYLVEVEPLWIAVDVPGVRDGSVLRGPDAAYSEAETRPGRRRITSAVLRIAPSQPGEWRLGSVTTVRATPYPLPVTKVQELELESEKVVTVLPADDPACDGPKTRAKTRSGARSGRRG